MKTPFQIGSERTWLLKTHPSPQPLCGDGAGSRSLLRLLGELGKFLLSFPKCHPRAGKEGKGEWWEVLLQPELQFHRESGVISSPEMPSSWDG